MNAIAIDKARRLDIYTRKDGTFHKEFLVLDADGDDYDFTDHTVSMKIFSKIRTNPALVVDIDNHMTVEEGKFTIDVPPEEMDFRKEDNYYQLWVTSPEGTFVWLNGKFVVNNFNLFDGINATTGVAMTIGDQNVTIIIGGGNGMGPSGPVYWQNIQGDPSSNQSLTEYIAEMIDEAGGGGSSVQFGGGLSSSGGVARWGGTTLDADVVIPGGGRGVQFGQDGSQISFFRMFASQFEFEIDQTVARMQHNGGFAFEGSTGATVTFNDFDAVGIGTDSPDGSALLDLVSQSRVLLLTRLQALSAVGVPRDGMVTWSDEFNDVVARVGGQWSPLTRAKVVPIADASIMLNESHRNKVLVLTGVGNLEVILPAPGTPNSLAADFTTFIMLSEEGRTEEDTSNIKLVPQQTSGLDATLDAFHDTIFAGGATVIQAAPGTFYASGSLGPFVDSDDIYAAIDNALEAAEDYTDGVAAGLQIQITALQDTATSLPTTYAPINLPIATEVTATSTLALTQANKLLPINVASGNTQTVPLNSVVAFPIGTVILLQQVGAGQVTIAATGGVTIQTSGTKLKIAAQYGMASLVKKATDVWALSGDLTT